MDMPMQLPVLEPKSTHFLRLRSQFLRETMQLGRKRVGGEGGGVQSSTTLWQTGPVKIQ